MSYCLRTHLNVWGWGRGLPTPSASAVGADHEDARPPAERDGDVLQHACFKQEKCKCWFMCFYVVLFMYVFIVFVV